MKLLDDCNLFHFENHLKYLPIKHNTNFEFSKEVLTGINLNEENKSKDDKKEEKLFENDIEEEVEKIQEIKEIKEKINNCVNIGKKLICRKCNNIPNDEICYFIKCKHFLCYKCFKKMHIENNKKKVFLSCPFCGKTIKKNKIVLFNFKE